MDPTNQHFKRGSETAGNSDSFKAKRTKKASKKRTYIYQVAWDSSAAGYEGIEGGGGFYVSLDDANACCEDMRRDFYDDYGSPEPDHYEEEKEGYNKHGGFWWSILECEGDFSQCSVTRQVLYKSFPDGSESESESDTPSSTATEQVSTESK